MSQLNESCLEVVGYREAHFASGGTVKNIMARRQTVIDWKNGHKLFLSLNLWLCDAIFSYFLEKMELHPLKLDWPFGLKYNIEVVLHQFCTQSLRPFAHLCYTFGSLLSYHSNNLSWVYKIMSDNIYKLLFCL